MTNSHFHLESSSFLPQLGFAMEESNWYAVHTMARHETRVVALFEEKRVCTYPPLLRQIHRWCDRRSVVGIPMLSCYAFVHMVETVEERFKGLLLNPLGGAGDGKTKVSGFCGGAARKHSDDCKPRKCAILNSFGLRAFK